jgi:eukaryotic-like serine/threonine-protein kinase
MSAPNPFGPNPFDQSPAAHRPPGGVPGGPPPRPPALAPGDEPNTLATLSLIFAFVFAPAGAILGHVGLSQIARTRQKGRDRALVGITLSYAVITAAVVALVVWAALGHNNTPPAAAPPTLSAPSATVVTSSTAAPPPTVAPADVDGLMPTLDEIRAMTGDQSLTLHQDKRRVVNDPDLATLDRPDCIAALSSGSPDAYNVAAVTGYLLREARDTTNPAHPVQVAAGIAVTADAAAARTQHDSLLAAWRRCSDSTVVTTYPNGTVLSNALGALIDSGNGITNLTFTTTPGNFRIVHLLAAKANVVVDAFVASDPTRPEEQAALALVNAILDKTPGPR